MGLFSTKKGRERRKKRREERRKRRQERKDKRHERRMERRQQRYDFRLQKQENRLTSRENRLGMRQEGRSFRQSNRVNARMTAYANGIDPNAWIGQSIGSVANAAASIYGAKYQSQMFGNMSEGQIKAMNLGAGNSPFGLGSGAPNQNMMLYVGLGILALIFFNKSNK